MSENAEKEKGISVDLEGMTLEELEALEELVSLEEMEDRWRNPTRYFIPTGDQEKLIEVVGDREDKWIVLMSAANSIGKTAIAVVILSAIIWGAPSKWFRGKRYREWSAPKKFWYMSEQSTLKGTVVGTDDVGETEIRKWFPKGRYTMMKGGYDYWSILTTDNGWRGSFKTYDMAVSQFESEKIGVAIFDEPPPQDIFNAVLARMTMGGIVLMPMTPLTQSAWTLDRLIAQGDEGPVYVFNADIEGACLEHGVRGFLDHDRVAGLIEQYDDDERDARAHGLYTHLKGLVYKGLNQNVHVCSVSAEEVDTDRFVVYNVVDPHDARPPFVIWAAQDSDGQIRVVEEFPKASEFGPYDKIRGWKMTTREVCERIKAVEQRYGWNPRKIIRGMDPNFGRSNDATMGETVENVYWRYGREIGWPLMFWTDIEDDLATGHMAVRDLLAISSDQNRREAARLKISDACPNVWHHLTHYMWIPREGKALDRHGAGEQVGKKYKDGADVVRYLAMMVSGGFKPRVAGDAVPALKPEHYGMYDKGRSRRGGWRDPHSV